MIFRYLPTLLLFFLSISLTSSHLLCSLPLCCLIIPQVKWGPKRDGYALMMTAHHVSWLSRRSGTVVSDQLVCKQKPRGDKKRCRCLRMGVEGLQSFRDTLHTVNAFQPAPNISGIYSGDDGGILTWDVHLIR